MELKIIKQDFSICKVEDLSQIDYSEYNTDYILVKEESFAKSLKVLESNGCTIKR